MVAGKCAGIILTPRMTIKRSLVWSLHNEGILRSSAYDISLSESLCMVNSSFWISLCLIIFMQHRLSNSYAGEVMHWAMVGVDIAFNEIHWLHIYCKFVHILTIIYRTLSLTGHCPLDSLKLKNLEILSTVQFFIGESFPVSFHCSFICKILL